VGLRAVSARDILGGDEEDALSPRTGELIVARGLATADQVEAAVGAARARNEPICSRLLSMGIDEGHLAAVLAERHGVPGVDLSRSTIALDLLEIVPRAVAEGDLVFPLSQDGGRIHVAMARPWDDRILSELRFVTGREVSPYVAIRGALLRAIHGAYEARERGDELWRGPSSACDGPHLAAIVPGAESPPAESPRIEGELIPDAEIVIEVETDGLPAPARGGRAPLVLVVDDEPDIRQLVQRMLESNGYAVELAVDGQEGLDKADALVPDLVLLDAMLPRVHGFDACRRIKASARTRHVPVVMMTAIYRGWRFAQDARDSYGAVDYVEKPFRLEDLLRRIEEAMLSGGDRPAPVADGEESGSALVAHGRELLAAGNTSEAIAVLSEAVRSDPRSAGAQFQLGRALRAAGDVFGAMTALEHAIEARPRHLPALRALAAIYEESGFRRKAAEMLERALPAAPDEAARTTIRTDLMRLIA
jgi:CheY-like chemotaxis protein/Fe2+ transport system protein FeoA